MAINDVEAPAEDAERKQDRNSGQRKKDRPQEYLLERWCRSFTIQWTKSILKIKAAIVRLLLIITNHAATHPKTYVVCIILLSSSLLVSAHSSSSLIASTILSSFSSSFLSIGLGVCNQF